MRTATHLFYLLIQAVQLLHKLSVYQPMYSRTSQEAAEAKCNTVTHPILSFEERLSAVSKPC